MDAQAQFIDHASANYNSGQRNAESDIHHLQLIADKLNTMLDELEPMFAHLDVARDVVAYRGGIRCVSRSRWVKDAIAGLVAQAFADELLTAFAGDVLVEMVKKGCE